jgi:phospholipid transport system substrate-binding protein
MVICAVAAVFLISIVPAGSAQAADDKTAAFVQKLGDSALATLTGKDISRSAREKRVRTMLQDSFDVPAISRFAMGAYWKTATDAQRREYLDLFEDMVVQTYTTRFEEYSGQTLKVGATIAASDRDSIVDSQIIQKDGPPVAIKWRVRSKGGQLKIIDVVVEGVSMSVTQRSDFSAVIQRGGGDIEALLTSLRARRDESKKG